jgi:hypothetical protein
VHSETNYTDREQSSRKTLCEPHRFMIGQLPCPAGFIPPGSQGLPRSSSHTLLQPERVRGRPAQDKATREPWPIANPETVDDRGQAAGVALLAV